MPHTLSSITTLLTKRLQVCSEMPRFEATELIKSVTGRSAAQQLTTPEVLLTQKQEQRLIELVTRRCQGESLAHVLQQWDFYELTLRITPDTLAPRPETEQMVDWVLKTTSPNSFLQVLDLGTGSGAIALALAHARPNWRIVASDLSTAALAVAKFNAQQHHLPNVQFVQGSWFDPIEQTVDLIVSNPPYLAQSDSHWPQLRHEPRLALDGGEDGLVAFRQLIQSAPGYLNKGGMLVLEHGYTQAQAVSQLLRQQGLQAITTYQDLAGLDRFTCATAP